MRQLVFALTEATVHPHTLRGLYLSVPPPFTECANEKCMTSGFCHEVCEISAVLGYYTAYGGVSLLIFRDSLSVPSSGVKLIGPVGCPEMLARNYHHTHCNIPK